MKPKALLVLALVALALVHFGNACSSSFQTLDDESNGTNNGLSCASDESNKISLVQDWKIGYLGQKEVLYFNRGDGWIQVEGDMLFPTKGDLPSKPVPAGLSQGVGVAASSTWPNGKIPYVISSSLPNQTRVADAIAHWNTNLSGVISWVPRTTETDYVSFNYSSSGCASPVGHFSGAGVHPVELANDCGSGNVAHEMGHIVGLDHEQNRLDRDSYVTINFSKIKSGYSSNFQIDSSDLNYGSYDFGSIMHYTLTAFSSDGSQTITPKVSIPSGVTVGQRSGLSNGDISSVRSMYGASNSSSSSGTSGTTDSSSTTTGTGLFGHYYDGMDFKTLKRERLDSLIDFSWGTAAPVSSVGADYFSVRWNGWVSPSASGNYVFVLAGQDGYRLKIDGVTVVDNFGSTGDSQVASNPVALTAGQYYTVVVEFVARSGVASMHLQWRKDGGVTTVIPTSNLIPDTTSAGGVCSN